MSDPIPTPDDDLAATRARVAAQGEAALHQLRRLEDERDGALFALGEVAQERDRVKACLAEWQAVIKVLPQAEDPDDVAQIIERLKAQLAEWEALRHVVPGNAEYPGDIVRCIKALQAVADAAKALAEDEQWVPGPHGRWYRNNMLAGESRTALAKVLLTLGREWDWRSK